MLHSKKDKKDLCCNLNYLMATLNVKKKLIQVLKITEKLHLVPTKDIAIINQALLNLFIKFCSRGTSIGITKQHDLGLLS